MKKIFILLMSIAFAVIMFVGIFFISRNIFNYNHVQEPEDNARFAAEVRPMVPEAAPEFKMYTPTRTELLEAQPYVEKVTPHTKIVYEYFYEVDQKTVITEDEARYFQLGLTSEELARVHEGWEIVTFSESEVILRKTIEEPLVQKYVVGVLDGYITVFYEGDSEVKEITSTPITTLSQEEQVRLIDGIPVSGDLNLMKLLEDYGS